MKLKELLDKYGDYEINDFNIEEAFTELNTNDDCCGICIKVKKPKPKTVWDLNNKEEHYAVTDNGFIKHFDYSDFVGYKRDIGNVFLTKEEAEQDLERREVETLLLKHGGRRWFDGHNHNYHIGLDDYEEHLKVYILMTPTQGTIYFDTKEQAQNAVSEIGEERIKKALFEVR